MSFVRMGQDGSQVYVYEHINGSLHCCFCGGLSAGSPYFRDVDRLLAHLDEHRSLGHRVPEWLESDLRRYEAGDLDVG